MLSFLLSFATVLSAAVALPQGPNTLAPANPNLRTASYNGTFAIVPISKSTVQAAAKPFNLLDPASDKSLFPSGLPDGTYPVLVSSAFENDIRMGPLQIQNLLGGSVLIPYVDRLGDGKTPFTMTLRQWVGGAFGQDLMGVVPAVVGSLEGTTITTAQFQPNDKHALSVGPGEYTFQVKPIILPNPVSGPGVILEAIDGDFFTAAAPSYTAARTYHDLINRPLMLTNGLCQRNNYYFNETFTNPQFKSGKITLYEPALPSGFKGIYSNVDGYAGNAEMVGYNPETCEKAAANNDPSSLQ